MGDDDLAGIEDGGLAQELADLRARNSRLEEENAQVLRLLELTSAQAAVPGPAQTGLFEARPGSVDRQSAPEVKVELMAPGDTWPVAQGRAARRPGLPLADQRCHA